MQTATATDVIRKIEKLLQLDMNRGSPEGEVEAANCKIGALVRKHGISLFTSQPASLHQPIPASPTDRPYFSEATYITPGKLWSILKPVYFSIKSLRNLEVLLAVKSHRDVCPMYVPLCAIDAGQIAKLRMHTMGSLKVSTNWARTQGIVP